MPAQQESFPLAPVLAAAAVAVGIAAAGILVLRRRG